MMGRDNIKNILVIGAQGYIGSRLTDFLQKSGHRCTGLDTGFFKNGVLYQPHPLDVRPVDARMVESKDLEGHDVVIMLAGISNDPFGNLQADTIYDPSRDYALKIAAMCKNLGIRYIFPSSCSVYGIGADQLDEKSATNPQTPYSLNKIQIEEGLASLCSRSFSPIALRLATVFGVSPRMRFDIVINMLCGLAISQNKIVLNSDGQAWRPHLHIDDACRAFLCCIEWDYDGGELMVLNVGRNDNNYKIIDIAKEIQAQLDGCRIEFLNQLDAQMQDDLVRDRKIQDGVDKRTYRVNFDKIHKLLPGFCAEVDIPRGIKGLIEQLHYWQLNEIKFKQRDFYRLQQLEYLHQTKQIDDNLFWNF